MTDMPVNQTPLSLPAKPPKPLGSRIKTGWWYVLLVVYTIVLAGTIILAPLDSVNDWPILIFLAYMIFVIYLLAKRTVIKPPAPKALIAPIRPSVNAEDAIPDVPSVNAEDAIPDAPSVE